eukprot:4025328-Prymnesium_polylepis.2
MVTSASQMVVRLRARVRPSADGRVVLTLINFREGALAASCSVAARQDGTVALAVLLKDVPAVRQRRSTKGAQAAERSCGSAMLCFDLSFGELMNDAEKGALARQLALCYGFNRNRTRPFQLSFAGLRPAKATGVCSRLEQWSWDDWVADRLDDDAIAAADRGAFGGRRLVYLTSDASEVLWQVDNAAVYVIGGLVDHKPKEGAALRHASEHLVSTARLPLDEFVRLRKPALTCNAVVQILCGFAETRDWGRAVREAPAMNQAPLK